MKNPRYIFEYEPYEHKRLTLSRLSERIPVPRATLYTWFRRGASPRPHHVAILSNFLKCTKEDIKEMITRSHDIINAGYSLPFGLIIEKDMLKKAHFNLKNKIKKDIFEDENL